ncbi:RdgB/HAM1 family non-canonical purine NTP pyrophosphatase [Rubellimicrobium aerolatum]|uniref:dITP/XTP pyrophosphatase n=1 Tax=Rubellimicrobium aerolatum TaxID=490979 RepID=A0ABW0SA23_9RHOB|nr:RdgB/HAM1 family non-canonical purine NTP pyrophosphatase [Rubellimicrobium aerolatum]MBP1805157.1 XTP/dITP diphosphohydrolase [Rubellimicrobium aerolatum]
MRRLTEPSLVVATGNAGKLEEMRELLAPRGIAITSLKDHALPEPEETEDSFLGNARIKAHAAAKALGLPALADDSGIEVEALGGAPGVRTADWAEGPGGRDFLRAMTRTHGALVAAGAEEPWRARFVSVLVLAWPDGHEESFRGEVNGRVIWPPRGVMGHGYDPIFVPEGETRTFAEMTHDEKNALSHRGRSIRAFEAACLG